MWSKIKIWLLKNWHLILIAFIAAGFFMGTASFNYFTQRNDFIKWGSPDETANYNFTKLYAQAGRLQFFEKYNILAEEIIHPRSFRSDFGWLKPVSFLGMILIYGKIASLAGYEIIPYLTPIFAALGIIFYYLFVKEIFGKRNALFSAALLAAFPPFIYYSARSMFHNVLFTVLMIMSLYFAVRSVKERSQEPKVDWPGLVYAALAGALFGLATITRSSELIWLLPLWLVIWLFNLKKIGFYKLIIFIAFALFSLLPALYHNKILYQSYWQGGYNEMNRTIANLAGAGTKIVKTADVKNNLTQIKNNVFYFGLQPLKSHKMFYYYFIKMFYWIFWPALLGFLLYLKNIKNWRRRHYAYFTAYAAISAILIYYYGSWEFHDNPDPRSHTIGNSYTRYWLPVYLGALPLVSVFFLKLSGIFKNKIITNSLRILLALVIFLIGAKFVLSGSDEGLIITARKALAARHEYEKVLGLTETSAVIITRYHDKLFFPERKVIVGLFDDNNMVNQYAVLAGYLPVYYYNFTFPEKDVKYLNNTRLVPFNLQIEPVEQVTKDFTLYRLKNVK